MTAFAIETKQLCFSFPSKNLVLNNLSLQVPENSIYGFLGPNGAGKTTTIRLLTGLLLSGADNIFLQGQSLQNSKPHIFQSVGCLIETPSLYLHLTGEENLKIITTLRRLPKQHISRVLSLVGLKESGHRKVKEYSLGMKQRLGIAMALLPDPLLLILDEPVNGLDPNGIVEIREMLIRLNKEEGKTIFLSSHLLHEVEKTCTHIGIINKGHLKYQGALKEMKQSAFASGEVVFKIDSADQCFPHIRQVFPKAIRQAQDEIIFPVTNSSDVTEINRQLVDMKIPVMGISARGGLEDWFMQIIYQDNIIA